MKKNLRRVEERSVIRRRGASAALGFPANGRADGGHRPFPARVEQVGGS
jgi:hypothetical protein